jgi:hypothetical protein
MIKRRSKHCVYIGQGGGAVTRNHLAGVFVRDRNFEAGFSERELRFHQ